VVTLCCVAFLGGEIFAQDNCATAVTRATKSYELGNLDEVISIITPCIDDLTFDDRWQAHRLLALAYLFRDEHELADKEIHAMLRLNPKYDRNPDRDPYELLQAMQGYETGPGFSVMAHFGLTTTSPNVVRSYGLSAVPQPGTYTGSLATAMGLGLEYHLSRSLSILGEGMFVTSSFTRSGPTTFKFSADYAERLTYLTFPASVKYAITVGAWEPFITAGGYVQIAPSATGSITGHDSLSGGSISQTNITSSARRRSFALGFLFGGGVAYPIGNGAIALSARYLNGLSDLPLASQRYSENMLLYGFHYIDDDWAIRNLELSLSYTYHLSFQTYRNAEGR
jgi:hypothetical protein